MAVYPVVYSGCQSIQIISQAKYIPIVDDAGPLDRVLLRLAINWMGQELIYFVTSRIVHKTHAYMGHWLIRNPGTYTQSSTITNLIYLCAVMQTVSSEDSSANDVNPLLTVPVTAIDALGHFETG